MANWRIGFRRNPCGFTSYKYYGWHNRYDDILKKYRTVYCAGTKRTCFRELLADFRKNAKAIREYKKLFGTEPEYAGVVLENWYDRRVLVRVRIHLIKGMIVDVENPHERRRFINQKPELLETYGFGHLDTVELRSRNREFTQKMSRYYFDEGKAGIKFRSLLDNHPCIAIFEGRGELKSVGEALPIEPHMREFRDVCAELGLQIV